MYKATKLLNMIAVLSLLAGLAEVGLRPAQVAAAEPGRAEIRAARTLTAPVIDGRLDESFWNVSERSRRIPIRPQATTAGLACCGTTPIYT